MTDTQKEQIKKLRSEGLGYVRIARELDISENTVKSFCRRMEKPDTPKEAVRETEGSEKHFCRQCGIQIEQIPGRKKKKFCSDACRMKWWNTHAEQINRKSFHDNTCPVCGRQFQTIRRNSRKYCCHECYLTARYGGGGSHD